MHYLIPSPSGLSKIIGSLSPALWMNSYVKSEGQKQITHNYKFLRSANTVISKKQVHKKAKRYLLSVALDS